MALRSKWTVRVRDLETSLRVGIYPHEHDAQPVLVSLTLSGLAESMPDRLSQCFDYEPICDWITRQWPTSAHTPLLETRVNELFDHVFASDRRILDVWVGLYKPKACPQARLVGLEREMTRRQHEEQRRARDELLVADQPTRIAVHSTRNGNASARLPAKHSSPAAPP